MKHFLTFLLIPTALFAQVDKPIPTRLFDETEWDYGLPELWYEECDPCVEKVCPLDLPCPENFGHVEANLIDPVFRDGMLTTNQGGVLKAPKIRIQAKNISYITQPRRDPPLCNVSCEGDLLIEYGCWVITADAIFYDFLSETGYILNGNTASLPWFIGGREMTIDSGGELIVHDGFITTSEGKGQKDPCVCAKRLTLTKNRVVAASSVHFKVMKASWLYLPKVKMNLKKLSRSPLSVKFGWGRFMDPYLSLVYNFMDWNDFKAMARLDGFFRHGVGVGIDTLFDPEWSDAALYTRNYWVHDLAIDDPTTRNRWRYQGTYANRHWEEALTIKAQYDFVSDGQMAYTYRTKDFDLKTAGATKILVRNQEDDFIANLQAVIQVNRFQSVNQQLPSYTLNVKPKEMGSTGIIYSGEATAAYLNYVFSNQVTPRTNFNGGRFSACPNFARPFKSRFGTATPSAGVIAIYYLGSPGANQVGQAVGKFGLDLDSSLHKNFGFLKHVAEPYMHYSYYTNPASNLDEHFIFSIDDGLTRLNQLRFGFANSFYLKKYCPQTWLWFDVWANAFFNQSALPVAIPTGFFDMDFRPIPWMTFSVRSGYSFAYHNPYYLSSYLDWTLNENFAVGFGYRARSRYYIRKEDFNNFMIDVTRTAEEILATPLSDRRQIFLFRTFIRPLPGITAKFDMRNGWNRVNQGPFAEYKLDLGTVLFQHWAFNFVIEHNEADMRYSCSLQLPPPPPTR